MCGLAAIVGPGFERSALEAMLHVQHHRGPDGQGMVIDADAPAGLGHVRLSIIDLSSAGQQPMSDDQQRYWIVFNGEIYNYLELRRELHDYPYRSQTDTEVILAAYRRWGAACLDHLVGMFSLAIWDSRQRTLLVARDRFGVKPLFYAHAADGTLLLASEIKALHAAGVPAEADEVTWATYLASGMYDHTPRTFWQGIQALPAGHTLLWQDGRIRLSRWYDLVEKVGDEIDQRDARVVEEEYLALLSESIDFRFRSDVPVGINVSGGLDSSILIGLVQRVQGDRANVRSYTFITGDERYDEWTWVEQMLAQTRHDSVVCRLRPGDVPELAQSVQANQDEPFGGLPTLAYALIFQRAREDGVIVLLDGQGMDEQWAGYEYYARALEAPSAVDLAAGPVQGAVETTTRRGCLVPEFLELAEAFTPARPLHDNVRNLQIRDTLHAKLPRALRFNDRISMRASVELREPFLDHRLFELAMRQPVERKIRDRQGKWLLRQIAKKHLPLRIAEAPKRPLQTPQREWLQTELSWWVEECIDEALEHVGDRWLDPAAVRRQWAEYRQGNCQSSFHIWQWISVGLCARLARQRQPQIGLPI
jgi:asparagine synthase (glutamine-hydrolysing)